jgi:hypothetical protein
MVGSTKEGFDFTQSNLLSRRAVLKQLWTQWGLGCLGIIMYKTSRMLYLENWEVFVKLELFYSTCTGHVTNRFARYID